MSLLKKHNLQPALIGILALAFLVRIAAMILLPDQPFPDARKYVTAATEFRNFHLMTNTLIMPLYPALIALVGSGWGKKIADLALSLVTVWLVYAIALQVYRREAIALIAALLAALWPHFVFFAAAGLTETLFITLMLAGLLSFYREHYFLGSIFMVLSLLTRPALEPLAPFLVLVFALVVHRRPLSFSIGRLAVYAFVYIGLMSPWWLHNYAKYGEFVRLNTAGGMVLYTGNNPLNRSGGGVGDVDVDLGPLAKIENPVRRGEAYTRAALDYIRAEPTHFLSMALVKFARLWRPWPYVGDYQNPLIVFISVASFLPTLGLAIFGLFTTLRSHFRIMLPCLLIIGFLTLVHMVTFGSVRYRIPLEPFVLIFAAAGVFNIAQHFAVGRSLLTRFAPSREILVS